MTRPDSKSEHDAGEGKERLRSQAGPEEETADATLLGGSQADPDGSPQESPREREPNPVLGVVVIYSDTHARDESPLDPRLGKIYPLRDGDILVAGRPPAKRMILRRDGQSVPPTHYHLFPSADIYGAISRPHVSIEMEPGGSVLLTDYSSNGIYLQKAETWFHRDDPDEASQTHRIRGEESLILMDNHGDPEKLEYAEQRSHYTVHILPFDSSAGSSSGRERQP